MLHCRHLNADEFQFVANGSDIEIGNFLQDGADTLRPLMAYSQDGRTIYYLNATERNAARAVSMISGQNP